MKWTGIIVALVLAWQVIGALIEQASKKKQAERLKSEAQRRQMVARSGELPPPPAQPSRPGGTTLQQRVEALAVRRKKQLEELQRRRQARRAGGRPPAGPGIDISVQTPTAPPTAQTMPTGAMPPRIVVTSPTEIDQSRAQIEAQRRASRPDRARQSVARPPAEPQPTPKPKRNPAAPAAPEEGAYALSRSSDALSAIALKARLRGSTNLRELFLLKEVLDPPLGLRPPDAIRRI